MRLNVFASLPPSLLLGFAALLPLTATAAHAAPGEAAAVIQSCGTPDSDTYGTSEATNLPQRTLAYGDTRLEFSPAADATSAQRWQFTNAWVGHLPESGNEIARHMTCFGQALQDVRANAADQPLPADPSIASQAQANTFDRPSFGITFLWVILFLAGVIAIFAVAIPRRKVRVNRPNLEDRPYRKPQLSLGRLRRHPKTAVPNRP